MDHFCPGSVGGASPTHSPHFPPRSRRSCNLENMEHVSVCAREGERRRKECRLLLLLLYSFHPLQTHFVKCSLSLSFSQARPWRTKCDENFQPVERCDGATGGGFRKMESRQAFVHSSPVFSFLSLPVSPAFPMYRQICPRLFDARHAHRSSPPASVLPRSAITVIVSTCRCFPTRDIATAAFTHEKPR